MEKPISLERMFAQKIFRIPDFQRGYAWRADQQGKAFWEDLVNLNGTRSHYTGVVTLREVAAPAVREDSKEYWLVDDHSYRLYQVVDGQQRLTTFVIFIQAFVNFFRTLPEHQGTAAKEIYVTDSMTLADVEERYLFRTNPKGGFRTYLFGYTEDNPSQEFLRFRILSEPGGKQVQETFYTLNLDNASKYFSGQIAEYHRIHGHPGLTDLFKRLTKRLLINEYTIGEEFDIFVAFETMNNRGKKLSDLELLKNRLIYLTTLYGPDQLERAGEKSLRDDINDAWKEVYYQLGRNKSRPLNDDDFLRGHWISYFKYSRDTGRDYAHFLLDEHFTSHNVNDLVERPVTLEAVEEQRSETELDDADEAATEVLERSVMSQGGKLTPEHIRDFVLSLRQSAQHWFNSFYPYLAEGISDSERNALDRLNRIGMGYFRPLVMVVLKSVKDEAQRLWIFERIERFIFIAFRIGTARSNYRSSVFYKVARDLNRGETTLDEISHRLDKALKYAFDDDSKLRIDEFYSVLFKKFGEGTGYYGWSGLRHFLYEYEQHLRCGSRQQKVNWDDLLKSENDRISIEHIYPQTPGPDWEAAFVDLSKKDKARYAGSLGNLLLLSMSINASLQNDAFAIKKRPRYDASGVKIRNGYSDGSHSEIKVAENDDWGPEQIRQRGECLLRFMEKRWDFVLRDEDREKLLFLTTEKREEAAFA
ncbi:GmrSD restriction endonuclease domain-containing protein [Paraburkholderia youngii]|uniref:GmrSD restriction endonuclease domain-containing protein n=1 Tax=Paraburkholderia youngii TaxID=2782701 RepID=UPI003D26316C